MGGVMCDLQPQFMHMKFNSKSFDFWQGKLILFDVHKGA